VTVSSVWHVGVATVPADTKVLTRSDCKGDGHSDGRQPASAARAAADLVRIIADGARHELLEDAHKLERAVECELPVVESHGADEPLVDVTSHFHLKLDCHR
jgi:hypothetical protein